MSDSLQVIAGRCTTVLDDSREQRGTATKERTDVVREQKQYGDVIVLTKPDGTS